MVASKYIQIVMGLTGSFGSGCSTLAEVLGEKGFAVG